MEMGSISSGMVAGTTASVSSPRLVRAAHEFEGQMMKELLKPMTGSEEREDSGDGSDSGGALGEFASEALGQALSARGGFGIADRIVHDLSRSGKRLEPGTVTGNLHRNTALRSSE